MGLERKMPDLSNLKRYIGLNSVAFAALVSGTPEDRQPLIIPQYTSAEIAALDTDDLTDGYLVFNTTNKKFYSFDETKDDFFALKMETFVTDTAINVTGPATAAQVLGGVLSSTSAAAVSITLPTVANLVAAMIAAGLDAAPGSRVQFVVNNAAGANTVTMIVGTGMSVNTPAITGGDTLTVSTANAVAIFEIVLLSGTTAKILRIA